MPARKRPEPVSQARICREACGHHRRGLLTSVTTDAPLLITALAFYAHHLSEVLAGTQGGQGSGQRTGAGSTTKLWREFIPVENTNVRARGDGHRPKLFRQAPSRFTQDHEEAGAAGMRPQDTSCSLVMDEGTKDSRDPQPVKLISHRGRIRPEQSLQGPQNQNQNSPVECEKGPEAEPAPATEQVPADTPCCFNNQSGGGYASMPEHLPAPPTLSPGLRHRLFLLRLLQGWEALPECSVGLGAHCGTRPKGRLLHPGANSRNDSAPPQLKAQPGPAGLGPSYLCGRCRRSLAGQCLSYLHSIWVLLIFHSTMYKQCQSQARPGLPHTCCRHREGQ